jgi:hypothetical protein
MTYRKGRRRRGAPVEYFGIGVREFTPRVEGEDE